MFFDFHITWRFMWHLVAELAVGLLYWENHNFEISEKQNFFLNLPDHKIFESILFGKKNTLFKFTW